MSALKGTSGTTCSKSLPSEMMKLGPSEVDSVSRGAKLILQPAFLNLHLTSFHQILFPMMCNVWQSRLPFFQIALTQKGLASS